MHFLYQVLEETKFSFIVSVLLGFQYHQKLIFKFSIFRRQKLSQVRDFIESEASTNFGILYSQYYIFILKKKWVKTLWLIENIYQLMAKTEHNITPGKTPGTLEFNSFIF